MSKSKEEISHFADVGGWYVLSLPESDREHAKLVSALLECLNDKLNDPAAAFLSDVLYAWAYRRLSIAELRDKVTYLCFKLEDLRGQIEASRQLGERYPELVAEPAQASRFPEAE